MREDNEMLHDKPIRSVYYTWVLDDIDICQNAPSMDPYKTDNDEFQQ
jgi:hypothetical protein